MKVYKGIAKLLGIKISHVNKGASGEQWEITAPASPTPPPFSSQGEPIYCFDSEAEVEAFITGYSLMVRAFLDTAHKPQ